MGGSPVCRNVERVWCMGELVVRRGTPYDVVGWLSTDTGEN
jgi:hypothetical protein